MPLEPKSSEPNPFRRKPKVSVDDFSDFLEPHKKPVSSDHIQKVRDSMKQAFRKATDKDKEADARDRAKEAERTRNRRGGAGYDPTDVTESFANRVFESAWQRKEGKNKEGGLNEKGRKAYERENPGSDLKAPVSAAQAKKSKGGKAAKRRKSFCARMSGMPGPMKDEKGRPTRKALSLRKWDC